jgi:hypothetical protein
MNLGIDSRMNHTLFARRENDRYSEGFCVSGLEVAGGSLVREVGDYEVCSAYFFLDPVDETIERCLLVNPDGVAIQATKHFLDRIESFVEGLQDALLVLVSILVSLDWHDNEHSGVGSELAHRTFCKRLIDVLPSLGEFVERYALLLVESRLRSVHPQFEDLSSLRPGAPFGGDGAGLKEGNDIAGHHFSFSSVIDGLPATASQNRDYVKIVHPSKVRDLPEESSAAHRRTIIEEQPSLPHSAGRALAHLKHNFTKDCVTAKGYRKVFRYALSELAPGTLTPTKRGQQPSVVGISNPEPDRELYLKAKLTFVDLLKAQEPARRKKEWVA